MIYTVTLNPTLDITFELEEFLFGEPVKAVKVTSTPGGKGINVSRALRCMGVDSVAMGLLGGYRGEEVLDLLQKEGLILQVVKIKNETRTNITILGKKDGRELSIRAVGPDVETEESERLTELVLKKAQAPEALVLSGSLPHGVKEDIYHAIITEGKKQGIRIVLDSDGEPMRLGIEAGPYLIKPNRVELERLAGRALATDDEIVEFARGLVKKGVGVVVASLGSQGAVMVTGEGAWKGMVPPIDSEDTVGAGDSTVAGMVMGMVRGEAVEDMLQRGLACGLSAVMNPGPNLCSTGSYLQAAASVIVERIA
jgi:1-phosphofructokinase family hexose kinase